MQFARFAVATGLLIVSAHAFAQPKGFNYDEAKVPNYTLPDPLKFSDGTPVKTAKDWSNRRRAEVLKLFQREVYGAVPKRFGPLRYRVLSIDKNALGGKATRKQIQIQLTEKRYGPLVDLLIYQPNKVKGPVPAFVGYNFYGNHTVNPDPGIKIPDSWSRGNKSFGVENNRATGKGRGKTGRWDIDQILDRGYALATMYYGDVEPDHAEGWMSSLRAYHIPPGRTTPAPEQWGAIAAWSYGLSRAMDYLEKDRDINHKQVAVIGHSRLGKTSLWAGASDERFAIVISNNSGCGGAALSRRRFGETVKRINTVFPHWFNENYNKYNDQEDSCPVDQHMLIALMAPRPVYVASAEKDQWADPNGEFTSAKLAEPVYALFGLKGLGVDKQPGLDQPVGNHIGYHYRTGKHDVLPYDWTQYLNFADRHFGRIAKK